MTEATSTPTGTANDLAAENAQLKAEMAEIAAAKEQATANDKIIVEKMAKGLRREQAAAVVQRQREHDARNTKAGTKK
jgi:hypothetical protein